MDGAGQAAKPAVDSGLAGLVLLLRVNGIMADPTQIRHDLAVEATALSAHDLLRAARRSGARARWVERAVSGEGKLPLPALAALKDGGYLIVAGLQGERWLVQEPGAGRPSLMSMEDLRARCSGRFLLIAKRASLSDLGREFNLSWFAGAIARYRRMFAEVLVASFFIQLLGLVTPLFFQVVIDKVLVHRGLSTLDVLMIGLGVVTIFEVLLTGLRTYLFSHTANRVDVELGARLFRHLFALPIGYFQARRVGDSVARVRELETIRQFLTGSALTLVLDLVFTVVFVAVMFHYSATLTWIVVGTFPLYITLSVAVTPMFRRKLDEKFKRGAENQAFLVESVSGVETLKAMAIEPQAQRRWEEQLAGYVRASFSVTTLGNWASQAVMFINKGTTVLTLFFGARLVIDGTLTVGELVAFNMLAGHVAQPVLRLAQLWQDFQQARLSVNRLGDILNSRPEPAPASKSVLPAIKGQVAFREVSFRYRLDGPKTLSNIDLTIAAGQVVGIVGSSGSGKSTLAKLVQRLYVPESGRVLIDGLDLALVDPAWLRRQIGVVLQENVLFNRSLKDNIALADPTISLDRVVAAAQLAGAHEFILDLPEGYDTEIGERGASLSGGQRQRVAIARALVGDPRVLIFDEATSALDYESEQIIQANMRRICAGRTVLVIAHRLSTVRMADRIITIEKGQIVEDGCHDDLVRTGGRYATLHRLQAGGTEAHPRPAVVPA